MRSGQDFDRRMRDESPQRLVGGGGSKSREHSQAALPSSLVRWNRLSSPCHNSTEDEPAYASTQEGARPRDFWLARQCITSLYFSTHTPLLFAYTHHSYLHTPNHHCTHTLCIHTHMHTHHSTYITHIQWYYIVLSWPVHTYRVISSYKLYCASCSMLAITVTRWLDLFSLFLYLGLNKENVCPVRTQHCVAVVYMWWRSELCH